MLYFNNIVVITFILSILRGNAQKLSGEPAELNKILNNISTFSKAIIASDYQSIASAYTVDGKLFPNNREIISGYDDIIDYWTLPEGVQIVHHKVSPEEIKILGEEAYDYGYYEGKTQRADGTEISWRGKYVIVWKRINDEWKMYLDIWNRITD